MKIIIILIFLIFKSFTSFAVSFCEKNKDYKNNCYATKVFSNGNKYIGEWQNNKMHGEGTMIYLSNISNLLIGTYEGQWLDGKKHGEGYFYFKNEDVYLGEFKNDYFHGHGKLTKANGAEFIGKWKDGKKHGFGTLTAENGKVQNGLWINGYFSKIKKSNSLNEKDLALHFYACDGKSWGNSSWHITEAMKKGIKCNIALYSDHSVCFYGRNLENQTNNQYEFLDEATQRGLDCGTVIASKPKTKIYTQPKSTISSAELDASKREAKQLRRKLAALEQKQKQEQQKVNNDTRVPLLEIISIKTKGKRGTITGIARDNIEVAEVTIDGKPVSLSRNGEFKYSTYVPTTGLELNIQVTDIAGLTSSKIVVLKADRAMADASISFDRLNPLGKRVSNNKDALALIVGVSNYENTKAKAMYADNDALVFKDYATEKLGIPENRIKMLINDGADYGDVLLTARNWLRRSSKPNQSDIYIFFAGHGLASDNGEKMYLLPFDGRPELLDKTALLKDELFADIQKANPKSVTVFLDTCYSGTTRGTDMLIASRPIAIRALKQSIPSNFTVFSAAAGDQTSKPLEEAKHGMFSYFLMKGMEGDADTNSDNKITAQELHAYVKENVTQQSSGSQTPELQGNKNRVLVQFN
ncbi:caspase family protein [Alphaproteobacteria bacterium]|nr:caspase family protein [Alphaproteobacteria bacterium]